jgi:Ala-tRNA(Pro) deacylase
MSESEDSTAFENIKLKLKTHNAEYQHTHHEPVRTSEQAAQIRNSKLECGAKAIVMKCKDKTEQIRYVLFVMSAVKKLDSKAVKKLLQVKSISFATEEEVIKLTKCLPGAVPPFGSVLGLQSYMDESLRAVEWIDFNAGLRTDSIRLKQSEYERVECPIVALFTTA